MLGSSGVAAQLAASQEGLSSMSERVSDAGPERSKMEPGPVTNVRLQKPYKYLNIYNKYFKKQDFLSSKYR
jgi:hypothetical protein